MATRERQVRAELLNEEQMSVVRSFIENHGNIPPITNPGADTRVETGSLDRMRIVIPSGKEEELKGAITNFMRELANPADFVLRFTAGNSGETVLTISLSDSYLLQAMVPQRTTAVGVPRRREE